MTTKAKEGPPVEELRALFDYDGESGHLVSRVKRWKVHIGDKVGTRPSPLGYKWIRLRSRPYLAHRMIWAHVFGYWPKMDLDHINGDKGDNRLCNLREATRSQNNANGKLRIDNKSGVRGVSFYDGRWHAELNFGGKKHKIGVFDDLAEAASARKLAEKKHFGEFVRAS